MMSPSPKPILQTWSRSLCVDAMFVVASTGRFDAEQVDETVRRRSEHYDALIRRTLPEPSWETWLVAMSAAVAPVAAPRWLPMREVVELLTLEGGARGVRSLFTSKPSDGQVSQTREAGRAALRCMTGVFSSTHAMDDEQRLVRKCFVHSLGLADDVAAMLLAEPSLTIEAIEIPAELETKTARAIARGIWDAAVRDGLDPVKDAVAVGLCARLGLEPAAADELRQEAQAQVDGSRAFGAAAVDAIRYVLADDPQEASRAASTAARLALPPVHRKVVQLAIEQGDLVMLAKRHELNRDERGACLSLAWLAALSGDPSTTRGAELAVRHDRIATDLGAAGEGAASRSTVEGFVREQLLLAVQSAGL